MGALHLNKPPLQGESIKRGWFFEKKTSSRKTKKDLNRATPFRVCPMLTTLVSGPNPNHIRSRRRRVKAENSSTTSSSSSGLRSFSAAWILYASSVVTTAVLLAASPSADAYGLQVNEGEGEQTPDGEDIHIPIPAYDPSMLRIRLCGNELCHNNPPLAQLDNNQDDEEEDYTNNKDEEESSEGDFQPHSHIGPVYQRETRSKPGYFFRTRKNALGESQGDQAKYMFRVRKQMSYPTSSQNAPTVPYYFMGEGQIRNRKGGYFFRTRKNPKLDLKRGSYFFRTRKSDNSQKQKRAGYLFRTRKRNYLFRTKKDPDAPSYFYQPMTRNYRRDMYFFRT